MTNLTRTDHAGPGSSSAASHLSSSDRAAGSTPSLEGRTVTDPAHVSLMDEAACSTLQEELVNLKDILTKYIAGRRKRRRENAP